MDHFEMRLLNLRINFYLLWTFCPHLGSFFVLFLLSLRFGQISSLAFFRWFYRDLGYRIFVIVCQILPSTNLAIEDQIRIYKTKKSILVHPSGPMARRIEVLSLYCSRWALSEDSGFKSYPSQPDVHLVKNVVR